MTVMHPEPGPYRGPDELSYLTPDMIMPPNPQELAQKHDAGTLHGYAMGEIATAEGYAQRASELREQAALAEANAQNARNRAELFMEAYDIVRGDENSS